MSETKVKKKNQDYVSLKALVMMQLKNKINLNFLKNKKKAFLRLSLMLIGFIALTVAIYFVFYFASVLRIFSFSLTIPNNVLVFIFTIMMLLSIITCSFGLMKSFYFARDNQILLTFPVTKTKIFISKLIVYYINELIKSVTFILPLFIAFGAVNGLPFYYYPWLLVCLFIVALVPVALGALFSIPLMGIAIVLKKNRIVELVSVAVFIGLVTWGIVALINIIPEDINIVGSWGTLFWDIQDFLAGFAKIFYPFTCLTTMMVGTVVNLSAQIFTLNTLIYLVSFIVGIAIVLGLSFLIARPLFFKMASKPFEYQKKIIENEYKNHKLPSFWSGVKKEFIDIMRTPTKLYTLLLIAIGLPVAILFLNRIFSAMSVRLAGTYMTIAFNILIIVLFSLSSNSALAKVYSEEGNAHYLYKTNPQKYYISLLPKLVINWVVMICSIIAATLVFESFAGLSVFNTIMLILCLLCLFTGHLFWSAEMDIMNPQFEQYQTTGQNINNPNENKSILIAFIIAILVCGISLFLLNENANTVYWKIFFFSFIFVVYRVYMFFTKIKLYYLRPYREEK